MAPTGRCLNVAARASVGGSRNKGITMRIALLLSLAAASALAQVERQHGHHEHGRITLQLAQADGVLEVRLEAPGSDLVGFEHVPAGPAQQAAIDAALAILRDAPAWLEFTPADACTWEGSEAVAPGYGSSDGAGLDRADEDARHRHDHHDAHGEFHAVLRGSCRTGPAALRVDLHRHFPGVQRVRVDFINGDHQGQASLQGGKGVVDLQP